MAKSEVVSFAFQLLSEIKIYSSFSIDPGIKDVMKN